MSVILFAIALLLSPHCSLASEDDGIFTSNADLQDLLWTEAELVRNLRTYIAEEEERIQTLKRYAYSHGYTTLQY